MSDFGAISQHAIAR